MKHIRGVLLGLAALVAVMLGWPAEQVDAAGVASFTGASLDVGAGPVPLPLGVTAGRSIPRHGTAILTVTGTAAGGAGAFVSVEMVDENWFWIPDVTLETHGAFAGGGGAFSIDFHLSCAGGNGTTLHGGILALGEVLVSSGEQTAEIYIEDGAQHIPVGTFWSISCDKAFAATIGPAGGVIDLPWADSTAVVSIPPGALPADTLVELSNALPIPNATSVPAGFLPISEALKIEPQSLTLGVPANVTLPYTNGEIEGYDEPKLEVLKFDTASGTWQVIPSTVDGLNNELTFQISSFGIFGFAGPPVPIGGTTELLVEGADAPVSAAESSGPSAPPYAAIAGAIAGGALALAAGGWYARRRLLR